MLSISFNNGYFLEDKNCL